MARIFRGQFSEAFTERLGNHRDVVRIGLHVRSALRVNVALCPVNVFRYVEPGNVHARLEKPGSAGPYRRVVGFAQQLRQPADFQFRTAADDQVGTPYPRNQGGPRLDVVWVLQSVGCAAYLDQVSAERLRQAGPFRFAGENPQVSLGPQGRSGQ